MQQVDKNTRNNQEFIRTKAEKDVPEQNRGGKRGRKEQQRLDPVNTALGQGTVEKQVHSRLNRGATETSSGKAIAKGCKTVHREKGTMRHFPSQINNSAIQGHEEELGPGGRPVQLAKDRPKLHDTVGSHTGEL